MSFAKTFRALAAVLVASFVPATALAATPTADAPAVARVQPAKVAKSSKMKTTKMSKATKIVKVDGKLRHLKPIRRTAR